MKSIKSFIALTLAAAIIIGSATSCSTAKAGDLMDGVKPGAVVGKAADAAFIASAADFSVELFKKTITDSENSLISPLSVMLALAMAANGAGGETLAQMEKLLGGGIPLGELNEYLYSFVNNLPDMETSRLSIANSIWFRDSKTRLSVDPVFLQKNADYYCAEAYASAFDSQTVREINNWVSTNTDGMINRILDEIDSRELMFLINAVLFDAEWQQVYYRERIREGIFTDISGVEQTVDFMHANEGVYLDDGLATGFMKPYTGGRYWFVALLPDEDVPIAEYINSLTGDGFIETLKNASFETVVTTMPKFSYDYSIGMQDALNALGIPDALDIAKADFSNMAASPDGNIYISRVQHKTFIKVDERGTKAGAATMVSMAAGSSSRGPDEIKIVRLDRPFVYAIIDGATRLPVFIGTLTSV